MRVFKFLSSVRSGLWFVPVMCVLGGLALSLRPARADPGESEGRFSHSLSTSRGSRRTQPFTHGGPGARVNMKCTNCGHLFHAKIVRS